MSASKKSDERIRLTVTSSDPVIEIYIIDGEFSLAEKGSGQLSVDLPPGLYKVKFKSGSVIKEKDAILEPGSPPVVVSAPEMDFSTSAPITQTRTARNEHLNKAYELSRQVHVDTGSGGELFVFVRDLEENISTDPAQGLSLRRFDGRVLVDFRAQGLRSLEEQWAGCNIRLDPGVYRLRLKAPPAEMFEQTLVISPGWQTQVFLSRRSFGKTERRGRRADLANASIMMTRLGEGFYPDREDLRWTELARMGLAKGRSSISSTDIRNMLQGKFQNPMLGIFCAHLLQLSSPIDEDLLRLVIHNTRGMIGDHPDLNALLLRQPGRAAAGRVIPPFEIPPMLRHSWNLVVASSAARPELVPSNSLAALVAPYLWGSGAWLVWQASPDVRSLIGAEVDEPATLGDTLQELEDLLTDTAPAEAVLESHTLDDMEESLLRILSPEIFMPPRFQKYRQAEKGLEKPGQTWEESQQEQDEGVPIREDTLIKTLGIPNAAAQKTAASLLDKLRGRSENPES